MADGLDLYLQRIGTTLRDKWTLERLIAVGGMAAVYVAVHKIGRRDAVKILRPEAMNSRELVERFEQEAHAVNRFHHPGVVEVRDFDRDENGVPFLVMELLEGEPLVDSAHRQRPPIDEALRYLDELLDVLAAAHAQGIIHRDIKPDNLFVTREGRLKVLDFGIARMMEGSPRQHRTAAGMVIGTPEYMSPEQVLGHKADARADLYSVGATFFWLLAGRHAHEAKNEMEVMVKVMTERAPPLRSVAPQVPASVGLVVDRALAFRADDRYPDAQTMQQDVRAVRRGEAPPYATLMIDSSRVADAPGAVVPLPPGGLAAQMAPPAAVPAPAPAPLAPLAAAPAHAEGRPQSTLPMTSVGASVGPNAAAGPPGATTAVMPTHVSTAATFASAAQAGAFGPVQPVPVQAAPAPLVHPPPAAPAPPAMAGAPQAALASAAGAFDGRPMAPPVPSEAAAPRRAEAVDPHAVTAPGIAVVPRPPPHRQAARNAGADDLDVDIPGVGRPGRRGAGVFVVSALAVIALGLGGAWFFREELGIVRAFSPTPSAPPPLPSPATASAPPVRTAPTVTAPKTAPTAPKPPPPPVGSKGDKKKGN
ncbi:MAG TPA: serine/threonine-protein kinase [Polyangiaceae bacterium]|nr:serine/threonine-protein kinase [Polyangiaceae bacterium]